jgi:1,4-dihydroxy-2-naphthoate octaprenyltransferase
MLAAWGYTGGPRPYGYAGLGEVFVFIFFGPVAVCGTTYVQARHVGTAAWLSGVIMGLFICALLVANNLRDVPTDREAGKITLAVLIGDTRSRWLYAGFMATGLALVVVLAVTVSPWLLLGLAASPLAARGVRPVLTGASGPALIPVLGATGSTTLVCSVGLLAGFLISR